MDEHPHLGPADLQAYLRAHGIPGEILDLASPTPTVETAAQAVGTVPERIVKSILFLVDGQPVLAITCGRDYVEQRALAGLFGVGRKRVRLADPETVLRETGYAVGAMPPFGHRLPLTTLMDPRVLENPEVYAGGGSDYSLLRIRPGAILAATGAQVHDLITPPGKAEESQGA